MSVLSELSKIKAEIIRGSYDDTQQSLQQLLEGTSDRIGKEEVLRQLFYLYRLPRYADEKRAREYLSELDRLDPSAVNAMEWLIFMTEIGSLNEAARWGRISVDRAKEEGSDELQYSAIAFAGLVAAKKKDIQSVMASIQALRSFALSSEDLPFGDEVGFLEAAEGCGQMVAESVRDLAKIIVPKINDAEFKLRATKLL